MLGKLLLCVPHLVEQGLNHQGPLGSDQSLDPGNQLELLVPCDIQKQIGEVLFPRGENFFDLSFCGCAILVFVRQILETTYDVIAGCIYGSI